MEKQCTLKGYIYGEICGDLRIFDAVSEADLFFVRASAEKPVLTAMQIEGSDLKPVVRQLSETDTQALRSGSSVMIGKTDDKGAFCIDDQTYQGTPLDVYVCVNSVTLPTLDQRRMPLKAPFCLYLGTYAPEQRETGWYLVLRIPKFVWCRIKRLADAWTIAGRVTVCDSQTPVGNVKVTARDVDWTQQDVLGSAFTSSGGIFRIDYPGEYYRKGTLIDIELFGGPDVYFAIEDSDGNILLDEPPSTGRSPGRSNSGPCLCVELCVKLPVPTEGETVPSVWTGIGTTFTIPDSPMSLNDFTADGYAGTVQYAFTGAVRLTGSAPRHMNNHPVEYRFLISDTTALNSDPALAAGNFTRIVGVSPNDGMFVETRIGQMIRFAPFKIVDVYAKLVDLDTDGWLDVNKSILRTFVDRPDVDPVDLPDFVWVDLDALLAINTAAITTMPDVPAGAAVAGAPVPVANQIGIEKIAIRFEAREVIDKATNSFVALPASGTTLNAMVINNNPTFMKVAMTEHIAPGGDPCGVLTGQIHTAYTVHHPHLRNVSLTVTSNDGSFNASLEDAPQHLPLTNNTDSTINHLNNAALSVNTNPAVQAPNPVQVLHKCSYLVELNVLRRLHTGDTAVDWERRTTTFYYEP